MPDATINGVRLHYEQEGSGEVPLVLVHGSWVSHRAWDRLVPHLSGAFRVVRYDRRGHSQSERPSGQRSVHEDVDDLAGLIEHLGVSPAWVVGNSFGAAIALRLAGARPDLLRGLVAHEPPLFPLLAQDQEHAASLDQAQQRIQGVLARIAAGDHAGAAEEFVDTVAVGPGAWAQFPAERQAVLIENAPAYLAEAQDPDALAFDLASLDGFPHPMLLTKGDQSPPTFPAVIRMLEGAVPRAQVRTLPGAGHIPHQTHPEAYAAILLDFIGSTPRG
jgi:pimeloyl-ACP methyl ester carboxylesterase